MDFSLRFNDNGPGPKRPNREIAAHLTNRSMRHNAKKIRDFCRVGLAFLSLLIAFGAVSAQRLPLKNYTTAEGLPHNAINKIVSDSRGFLWFCTQEGLSRFDGYSFTNYATDQGLPHSNVSDFLETRGGEFWVGTKAGLVQLNPKGEPANRVVYTGGPDGGATPMFTTVTPDDKDPRAQAVSALLEARDGTIWVGTLKGLYRLERTGHSYKLRSVEIGMPGANPELRFITDLLEDRFGSLWVASPSGLYRIWADGASARYTIREGLPDEYIHNLLEDHRGQLWVGTRYGGFFRITPDATHTPPVIAAPYQKWGGWVFQLFETSDRRFWAATNIGLIEFYPDGDAQGRPFRTYTTKNGLLHNEITALGEDSGGNLWLGSYAGAMKLAREGFVTWSEQDGVSAISAVFGDAAGGVCFRGYVLGDEHKSVFEGAKLDLLRSDYTYHFRFGRFDGERFAWFLPTVPSEGQFGWLNEGLTLQARNGEWWIGTGEGLYRFPPSDDFTRVKNARPLAVYQTKVELAKFQQVFRIFEDSRGDVWASTIATPNGLGRWDRVTEIFDRDLADAPGLPSPTNDLARSFGEDWAGNVWIGFSSGVARYRSGLFTFFSVADGLPPGAIQSIHSDQAGRLWLASSVSGLIRVDDPTAERPRFQSYSTAAGLSGNNIGIITEDVAGSIYAGTGHGLDCLDPKTGRVKHFTTADGLVGGDIVGAFRARDGALWFSSIKGLSRFMPGTVTPQQPPRVLISNLYVAGVRQNISTLGENQVALQDLAANQNQLQVDFVALSFAPGEVLSYQYKLEGADADWSPPVERRTVNLAGLAPGRYRFVVRAINSDGVTSSQPATITFTVLRPVWRRWWFLSLVVLVLVALIIAAVRYRTRRLLELERVRTRIATDLHDDIGANLTRIFLLSELAKQDRGNGNLLTSIADIARESVSSMNDIVWAINPEHDRLLDLTRRMRQHAEEVFTLREIKLQFRSSAADSDRHLHVGTRRDVLLIFKEAVNNAARHSACTEVSIDFRSDHHALHLRIMDNGRGFEIGSDSEGQGLRSMARRAAALGGKFEITSPRGKGTTVQLDLPLAKASDI